MKVKDLQVAPAVHAGVGIFDLTMLGPQALDLGALEHQSGFELIGDEIVVRRRLVAGDQFNGGGFVFGFGAHAGMVSGLGPRLKALSARPAGVPWLWPPRPGRGPWPGRARSA